MAPIIFGFSDDEEEDVAAGADDEDIGDEEEQGGGGGAGGGNRATINPPGALPEAKRLRLHEPPPIGVDWKLAPKVLMADGASAVDAGVHIQGGARRVPREGRGGRLQGVRCR